MISAVVFFVFSLVGFDRWFYVNVAVCLNRQDPLVPDFYRSTRFIWESLRFFPHLVGVLIAAIIVLIKRPRGLRKAVLLILSVGAVGILATGIQDLVGRLRPDHATSAWTFAPFLGGLNRQWPCGFPSGESATAFALSAALIREFRRSRSIVLLAAAIGASRAVFGMHYWSDVIAGGLLGAGLQPRLRLACSASLHWATQLRVVRRGLLDGSIRSTSKSANGTFGAVTKLSEKT